MNEGSSRVAKPHPLPWGSALLSWQRAMKGAYFMSKTTKKLCYIALLVAVYVLLSMTFTIKTGNLEITFKSLPVVVAALLV